MSSSAVQSEDQVASLRKELNEFMKLEIERLKFEIEKQQKAAETREAKIRRMQKWYDENKEEIAKLKEDGKIKKRKKDGDEKEGGGGDHKKKKKKKSSSSKKDKKKGDGGDGDIVKRKKAAPHCKKCGMPRKGHPSTGCDMLAASAAQDSDNQSGEDDRKKGEIVENSS